MNFARRCTLFASVGLVSRAFAGVLPTIACIDPGRHRDVIERLTAGPVLTVTDPRFGARGDGQADDAEGILKAAAACPAGGVVHIPAGFFRLARPLRFGTKSHWTLVNCGTLFFEAGVNDSGVIVGDAVRMRQTTSRVAIVNFGVIDGNGANQDLTAIEAIPGYSEEGLVNAGNAGLIDLWRCEDIEVLNYGVIQNAPGIGIYVRASRRVTVSPAGLIRNVSVDGIATGKHVHRPPIMPERLSVRDGELVNCGQSPVRRRGATVNEPYGHGISCSADHSLIENITVSGTGINAVTLGYPTLGGQTAHHTVVRNLRATELTSSGAFSHYGVLLKSGLCNHATVEGGTFVAHPIAGSPGAIGLLTTDSGPMIGVKLLGGIVITGNYSHGILTVKAQRTKHHFTAVPDVIDEVDMQEISARRVGATGILLLEGGPVVPAIRRVTMRNVGGANAIYCGTRAIIDGPVIRADYAYVAGAVRYLASGAAAGRLANMQITVCSGDAIRVDPQSVADVYGNQIFGGSITAPNLANRLYDNLIGKNPACA